MHHVILAVGIAGASIFTTTSNIQATTNPEDTPRIVKEGTPNEFHQLAEMKKEEFKDDKAFEMWTRVTCPARMQAKGDVPKDCAKVVDRKN